MGTVYEALRDDGQFEQKVAVKLLRRGMESAVDIRRFRRERQILERHYGHRNSFDYVGTRTFQEHIRERLPLYKETLQKAGLDNGLDWRLLAAMAYQESHWDADAVSHTGVRGIMMLTNVTAQHMGIANREDPLESLGGGEGHVPLVLARRRSVHNLTFEPFLNYDRPCITRAIK